MPPMSEGSRRYAGRSAAERAAERRDRLVTAAVRVLGERGESAVTVRAVCAEAGLTERYFYEAFPSRDDALLAALDLATARVAEVAVAAFEAAGSSGGDAEQRVGAGLAAVVDLVADEPALGRVILLESAASPALRERRADVRRRLGELVVAQAAAVYPGPPPDDAALRGAVYVAGVGELLADWLTGRVEADRARLVATAGRLFAAVLRG